MGDLASCLVFGLTQSILNKYYTDVLEVSVLSVMIMTVVARIWDAINDPIWGRIIDGAKVRADGRYRHWIKVFAIPTAVAAVLMFADVRGFSSGGKIAWIYFSYILFGMLCTCINIPYGSLAQVITSSDKERSSLSVFRSIGSAVATILINVPLLRIGYSGSKLNTEGLTLEALKSMYNSSVVIPALLFLSVFLILRYMYPLSKQRIDQLQLEKEKVLGGQ